MDTETITRIKETITELVTVYGLQILAALAIFIIGLWVAGMVRNIIHKLLGKRNLDPTITAFISNVTYIGLLAFICIAALGKLGIQTGSFIAVLGAAGLAVGLALQGSLANFAAGFLLILFRPFRKGDYIEGGGTAGIVDEIQVFTTILNTPDNKRVIIPNAKLTSDNIVNYSAKEVRRLDMVFGVSYGDDIDKVRSVLKRISDADERILKEAAPAPAAPPAILVSEMADSSVNFILRVWVKTGDFWGVKFDTTEKVKKSFDAEDITIPFPQRDVHLFQEAK